MSFSSADIGHYHMMCAWKANEHIGFNFANFQLDEAINSENPSYIKSVCRDKIRRADTFILLIGEDTWSKTTFVQSEVEVAVEKGCRLIGVNINKSRFRDAYCPRFFGGRGALFVPFSPRIMAKSLESWQRPPGDVYRPEDWSYDDATYLGLGYALNGNTATLPPAPNPFLLASPPWWVK